MRRAGRTRIFTIMAMVLGLALWQAAAAVASPPAHASDRTQTTPAVERSDDEPFQNPSSDRRNPNADEGADNADDKGDNSDPYETPAGDPPDGAEQDSDDGGSTAADQDDPDEQATDDQADDKADEKEQKADDKADEKEQKADEPASEDPPAADQDESPGDQTDGDPEATDERPAADPPGADRRNDNADEGADNADEGAGNRSDAADEVAAGPPDDPVARGSAALIRRPGSVEAHDATDSIALGATTTTTSAAGSDGHGLSGALTRALGPVLPPAVTDAFLAPLVIGEALLAALLSSSQSMILPGVFLLASLVAPGSRTRWRRWIQPIELPGDGDER